MTTNLGELVARARLDTSGITRGVTELQRQLRVLQGTAAAGARGGLNQVATASAAAGAASRRAAGDVDVLDRSLVRANASSGNLSRGLGQVRSGAAQLTRVVGLTAAAVGAFGGKAAADMESAEIGFETLLGSGEAAKKMLADLQAFSLRTPFDFPGTRDAAQRLLAFGFQAEQIIPTLTAIGDAAAGLNIGADGVQRITVALGQISAKGRVQSQELLQLAEAGIKAPQILANAYGISQQQLLKYVEKGLIPASQAIPILLDAIEKGSDGVAGATAKFGGIMDRQSATVKGKISNLRDVVRRDLQNAFTPALPQLSHFLDTITVELGPAIEGLTGTVLSLLPALESIAPMVGPALQTIGDLAAEVAPVVAQLVTQVGPALLDAVQRSTPAVAEVAHAIGEVMVAASPLLPIIARLVSDLGSVLVPVLHGTADIIAGLANVVGPLTPLLAALALAFLANAAAIKAVNALKAAYASTQILFARVTFANVRAQQALAASTGAATGAILAEGAAASSTSGKLALLIRRAGVAGAIIGTGIAIGTAGYNQRQKDAKIAPGIDAVKKMIDLAKKSPNGKAMVDQFNRLVAAGASIEDAAQQAMGYGFAGDARPTRGRSGPDAGTARKAPPRKKPPKSDPSGLHFTLPPMGGSTAGKHAKSPEAQAAQSGLSMAMALRDGLSRGQVDVVAAAQALARSAAAGLTPVLAADTRRMVVLARQRLALADQIKAAQTRLTDALKAKSVFAAEVAAGARSFGDLLQADLASMAGTVQKIQQLGTDANGVAVTLFSKVPAPSGADGFVTFLKDRLAKLRDFAADIATLTRRHLNANQLRAFVEAGPEQAGAAVDALAAASDATLSQVNRLQGQIAATGKTLGQKTSSTFFDAGIAAAQGLLDGLKAKDSALVAAMKTLAARLVTELRTALKIKSPSRLTHDVGRLTGEGLTLGLLSQRHRVSRAAAHLSGQVASAIRPGAVDLGGLASVSAHARMAAARSYSQQSHQEFHVHYTAGPTMTSADLAADLAWLAKGGAG